MAFPRSQKLLGLLLVGTFLSPYLSAKADETLNNQMVTLKKPVYFSNVAEDYVRLDPGKYEIVPLPDSLQVTSQDESSSHQLPIHLYTHNQKLSEPIAVTVEGKPQGDSADRHILALYLPGGFVYEAEGTYSGIRTREVNPLTVITDPAQIYLEKPVHFLSPEGHDQVAQPGRYVVEQANKKIRLLPGKGQEAILLDAQENSHDGELNIPVALSLPGAAEEEADIHHVVLLLRDGTSLEATGTYSGIQSRGFFGDAGKAVTGTVKKGTKSVSKTVKRAKNTVGSVGNRVTSSPPNFGMLKGTAQDLGHFGKGTAKDAAKFAEKAALDAKRRAEWVAQQAAKGVQWLGQQACKAALKTAELGITVSSKTLSPIQNKLGKELMRPEVKKNLQQAMDRVVQKLGPTIEKALAAAAILNSPKNAKVLKELLKPDTMCEKSPAEIQKTIQKMAGRPVREALAVYQQGKNSPVRSRGVSSGPTVTFAIGGGLGGGPIGGELGFRFASDFREASKDSTDKGFFDIAYVLRPGSYSGGGGVIIGIFPTKNPDGTGGEFFSVGLTGNLPATKSLLKIVGGGIEFLFDFPWNGMGFQGFAVSPGLGVGGGKIPVEIPLKLGAGIPIS